MNKKRLTALADWLEAGAPHQHIRFTMTTFLRLFDKDGNDVSLFADTKDVCSTACCMAGALVQTYAPEQLAQDGHVKIPPIKTIAQRIAGLNEKQADALFIPVTIPYVDVTPQKAAQVVRHLLATGNVDWRVAGFENPD